MALLPFKQEKSRLLLDSATFEHEECTRSCLCNQYSLRKKSIFEKTRNLSIGVPARIISVLLNIITPSYVPQRLKVSFVRIGCFRKEPNNSPFFQKAEKARLNLLLLWKKRAFESYRMAANIFWNKMTTMNIRLLWITLKACSL